MDPNDLLDGDWDVHGGFGSRHGTNKKLGFSTVKDFTTTPNEASNASSSSSGNIATPSGVPGSNKTSLLKSAATTTSSYGDTNNISSSHIAAAYNLSGMMDSDDDDDDDDDGIRSAATNKHDSMAGGGTSNTSAGEILSTDLLQQQQNLLLNDQSRFLVEQIEFQFSKTFIQVCASKGNLLLVTDQNTCIYVDDDFERYREFKINVGDDDEDHEKIHKCFIDPSGYHVLVSMTNGDNYYFNSQNNKNPKIPVPKLKNMIIESVGWDSETCNRDQTGPILIGTSDSKIYECSLENDLKEPVKSPLKLLFDFNDCDMLVSTGPITGIEIVYFPKSKNSFNCYLILIATRLRLFEFVGGPTLQDVFTPYKQSYDLLRYKELPAKRSDMLPKCGELHLFKPPLTREITSSSSGGVGGVGSSNVLDQQLSFAWLSNAGIFHGVLNFSNPNSRQPQSGVSVISESEVIQYDNKSASQVMSISISEFHMFVLYPEKLQILMQPAGLCSTAASNVAVAAANMNPMLLMMNVGGSNSTSIGMNSGGIGNIGLGNIGIGNIGLGSGIGSGSIGNGVNSIGMNNSTSSTSSVQQDIEKFFQNNGNSNNNNMLQDASTFTNHHSQDLNLLVASLASNHVGEISLSDIRVVYSQPFPVSTSGELIGLCTDSSQRDRIIYLYSSSAVWRITIDDEEKDVWKLYLEQALDPKSSKESYFDIAYKLCKQDPKTKDIVLSAKADYYFKTGKYNEAANIYAMTSKSFEQVSIAFHNRGQKDALRIYVLSKLQILKKNIKTENQDATQLCCLCTWLTEMYLDKLNELYDLVNLQTFSNPISGNMNDVMNHSQQQQLSYEEQYKIAKDEFRSFLEQHKKYLNKETTFRLISSHGQTEEVIYFAMLIEDYERVISYCITEKDYKEALGILNKYCTTRQYEDYFYKFAPILMQHLPKETVNTLTQKRFLDSGKLIPALMRYISQQHHHLSAMTTTTTSIETQSATAASNNANTTTTTLQSVAGTTTSNNGTHTLTKKTSSQLTKQHTHEDHDMDDEEFTDSLLDDEQEEEEENDHTSSPPLQKHSSHHQQIHHHHQQQLNDHQQFSSYLTSEQQNHVIRYLEWCIRKQENEDPAIHNLLLTLYADLEDDEKLLTFLDTEGENNYYDPKYALRVCSQKKKIEACVRLYSSMQLFDDAVDLALENDNIELARECADKPEDDENKKKLWLKIAKHVINSNTGVKQAIEFLSYTDKIKLEDILPYFPDFSHIDDFKEEICKSLDQYKDEIEKLKSEMQEATQTASEIREDIKELKHRYGYITANAKCDLSSKSVLTTDFYLFPCQHVFRADALVEEVLRHSKSKELREKLIQLEEKRKLYNRQLEMLSNTMSNNSSQQQHDESPSYGQQPSMVGLDQKELSQLQDELRELDEILSAECPLCGEMMINSIDESFISQEEMETSIYNSWSIA